MLTTPGSNAGLLVHLKQTSPGSPGESTSLNLRVRMPLVKDLDKLANRFGRNRSDLARIMLESAVAYLKANDAAINEDGSVLIWEIGEHGEQENVEHFPAADEEPA